MSATRITISGLWIPIGPDLQTTQPPPAKDHSSDLFGHKDHCSTKQCGACWRCRANAGPRSVPVALTGIDQVVEPRWMDGTWGGPIPDAAYEQHCSGCGGVMTVYGPPHFDADGSADVATRCSTCSLYSGYSWTWDCPDDEDDDEEDSAYDQAVREYGAAYDAHQERAARLRAGLPAQSEADADLGLAYDLTEDDEADAVVLQNTPVNCPACGGEGCSACDQGRVPAWAADDVVTLTSGDNRPTARMPDDGSGEPNPPEGFLNGGTGGGKTVSGGSTAAGGRGGAGHRIAGALRNLLTRSALGPASRRQVDVGQSS